MNKKFRMTHQRRIILEMLRNTTTHPSADEIYETVRAVLPRISLGTVYRNLEILHTMGQIRKIHCNSAQMRFDGNTADHHHIRCIVCNRIDDIPDSAVNTTVLPVEIENYRVLGHALYFWGICGRCSLKKQSK